MPYPIVLKIENIIGLFNICGATDGTHIPLINLLNEILLHVLLLIFSIGKKSTILCFKLCVILCIKYFGTLVLANLERFPMANNSKHLTFIYN